MLFRSLFVGTLLIAASQAAHANEERSALFRVTFIREANPRCLEFFGSFKKMVKVVYGGENSSYSGAVGEARGSSIAALIAPVAEGELGSALVNVRYSAEEALQKWIEGMNTSGMRAIPEKVYQANAFSAAQSSQTSGNETRSVVYRAIFFHDPGSDSAGLFKSMRQLMKTTYQGEHFLKTGAVGEARATKVLGMSAAIDSPLGSAVLEVQYTGDEALQKWVENANASGQMQIKPEQIYRGSAR